MAKANGWEQTAFNSADHCLANCALNDSHTFLQPWTAVSTKALPFSYSLHRAKSPTLTSNTFLVSFSQQITDWEKSLQQLKPIITNIYNTPKNWQSIWTSNLWTRYSKCIRNAEMFKLSNKKNINWNSDTDRKKWRNYIILPYWQRYGFGEPHHS